MPLIYYISIISTELKPDNSETRPSALMSRDLMEPKESQSAIARCEEEQRIDKAQKDELLREAGIPLSP